MIPNIAHSGGEARPSLKELRGLIKSAIPGVEERISWGVPFYLYHGALAGFALYKGHVSFGGVSGLPRKDRDRLEKKGYKTWKKIIQIKFGQKVPAPAIRRILKAQAKRNEAKKGVGG